MLIAEREPSRTVLSPKTRSTPGYTLGEAARIRRDILARLPEIECPRCAGKIGTVQAGPDEDAIWIAGCNDCRLSLVVHCRAGDLS
jgi:hypothetical protein